MFDSEHRHFHSSPVNVSIKQQPNDAADAARLYGELEAKATAAIAGATIETLGAHNEIKFLSINSYQEPMWMTLKVRLVFSINGKQYDIITENNPDSIREQVYGAIMSQVFDQCVKALHNMEQTYNPVYNAGRR